MEKNTAPNPKQDGQEGLQKGGFQSLMRTQLPHNTSFTSQLKSFSSEYSTRLHKDDDGILSYRVYSNDPGFYNFWRTADKSLKLHNFGHTEKFNIQIFDSEERNFTSIIVRAGKTFSASKSLHVSLAEKTTNGEIDLLGHNISRSFPNLQELTLTLACCSLIDSEGLTALAKTIGLHFPRLQRLNMIFYSAKEGTELMMKDFVRSLSRYGSKITHLQVNLSIAGNTQEELITQFVSETTKRLPNLQGFGLSYTCRNINRVTDNELIAITDEITSKLRCLKSLSLHFSSCFGIRNKGMETISQLIRTNVPNLQSLSLGFEQCDEITQVGLETIAKQLLPSLKNLEQLSLNFRNVGKLTDESFQSLLDEIYANLKNLKKLDLTFGNCWRITATKWESTAGQLLEKLTKLKELRLKFSWNTFSDVTFNKLCEGIRQAKGRLEILRIELDNCKGVNGRSIEKYREVFLKYPKYYIC